MALFLRGGGGFMAISAYILMETSPGKAREIKERIKGLNKIKTAHLVTGPYDIIALAETTDLKELGELVISQVQALEGINKTLTSIVAE